MKLSKIWKLLVVSNTTGVDQHQHQHQSLDTGHRTSSSTTTTTTTAHQQQQQHRHQHDQSSAADHRHNNILANAQLNNTTTSSFSETNTSTSITRKQHQQPSHHHTRKTQLPPGVSKRKTAHGQVYFVDTQGHKFWYDPSVPRDLLCAPLNLDALVGKLSSNWEKRHTSSGKPYYVNHIKKTTQFTDPRLVAYRDHLMSLIKQLPASSGPYNQELFDKISILRQELIKQQVIGHPCRIEVHRKRIFKESFRLVSQMPARDLKKRLLIKFRGEEGLDYGGVAREWFHLLSREILNPIHGLFQYTSDDVYNLQINPDSGIVYREHLDYMNFCGRIIGMALFHGHFIEAHFTLPFYKMLLRKPITLSDIELVDSGLYRSLCWLLENDIANVIDTTFLVQHNAFGKLQEHELKKNGRNIAVTEENKHEYVTLYVNYRCRRGIAAQFEALQRGFYELVSPWLVENFDEHELELLIGGLSEINIEDWRAHTKLKNCTVETPLVRWFWDIVKGYDEDKRARLLQFVTGSPRVPIQGFKGLRGVNSEQRLFTIHLIKNACTDNLPKAHTCFNRIDLPPYESYEKLRDKLTQAIEETMGFAMQ